jgi:hypothetical protein
MVEERGGGIVPTRGIRLRGGVKGDSGIFGFSESLLSHSWWVDLSKGDHHLVIRPTPRTTPTDRPRDPLDPNPGRTRP